MSLVTVSDYVTYIRDRLRESTANVWTDAQLVRALNEGFFWQVEELARNDPTYLHAYTTISYVANQATYDLPINFWGVIAPPLRTDLDPDAPISPVIYPDYWRYLQATSYNINLNNEVYNFEDQKLRIFPTPTDATKTLRIDYARRPPALTSGTGQAGSTGTTLVLDATPTYGSNDVRDDVYNGTTFLIASGTGVGETAVASDYDGGTVTVTIDFTTAPDATSVYTTLPPWPEQFSYGMCYKSASILLEDLGMASNCEARAQEWVQKMIRSVSRVSGPRFTRSYRARI